MIAPRLTDARASSYLPFLPSGTVYGALLNFRTEAALWAERAEQAPYMGAPRAPVLYIKTANTFSPSGACIGLPGDSPHVEIGASIGLVMGDPIRQPTHDASKGSAAIDADLSVHAQRPITGVCGCVLVNDLSLPHTSYYRPPVKFRNRDGFLGIGPRLVPMKSVDEIGGLSLEVRLNGRLCQTVKLCSWVRDATRLVSEVSTFITLRPGDILIVGTDCLEDGSRPRASAGDRVEISAPGFDALSNTFRLEAGGTP